MTRMHTLAAAVLAAMLPACAGQQRSDDEIRSYVREVTGDDLKSAGRLQVATSSLTTDGRVAKIRGTVQSTFDEPVDGVRYVVVVYDAGATPRVLLRWQHEADTVLAPGERKAMRLDVESLYFGAGGGVRFTVEAHPVKLGGREMPPPEGWN